ncbi:hypothetical protein T484DRAFT_2445037 [Baffinella frigidus]|nr:hypothetical protein T484DRAFT_2445037 [Cryptophyta sp. CCMP2293]
MRAFSGWILTPPPTTPSLHPLDTLPTPSRHPPYTLSTPSLHPLDTLPTPSRHPPYTLSTPSLHPLYNEDDRLRVGPTREATYTLYTW